MSNVEFFDAFEAVQTARLLAHHLLIGPPRSGLGFSQERPQHPASSVVCGVGVVQDTERNSMAPLILQNAGELPSAPSRPKRVTDVGAVRNLLTRILPNDEPAWQSALVFAVPPPRSYAASRDPVKAKPKVGIAGARVTWGPANAQTGLLTAGHVVGANSSASVAGVSGNVAFAKNFISSGTRPEADIAVIDLTSASPTSTITRTAVPTSNEWLDILTSGATKQTQVMGKLFWLYFPADQGTAGDLYMTYPGVTVGGDSGAAAVRSNSPSEIVGHVIGGSGPNADYIQDIRYQLAAINLAGIQI